VHVGNIDFNSSSLEFDFLTGLAQWRSNGVGGVGKVQKGPECRVPLVSGKKIKIIFPLS